MDYTENVLVQSAYTIFTNCLPHLLFPNGSYDLCFLIRGREKDQT